MGRENESLIICGVREGSLATDGLAEAVHPFVQSYNLLINVFF